MSYTDRQYQVELERYKNAPKGLLRKIKSSLQFQFHLTAQQEARLAAVTELFNKAQTEYKREYSITYSRNHREQRRAAARARYQRRKIEA